MRYLRHVSEALLWLPWGFVIGGGLPGPVGTGGHVEARKRPFPAHLAATYAPAPTQVIMCQCFVGKSLLGTIVANKHSIPHMSIKMILIGFSAITSAIAVLTLKRT